MPTQIELARQMIQQLRILDPSISAEIGTPERKIIDTVAQAISENSLDLDQLGAGLDLDSKTGKDLDNFLALFGFGRQQGVGATGFVTFRRTTTSNYDIPIPRGTQVKASAVSIAGTEGVVNDIRFYTSESVTLRAGDTSVIAPIRALLVGTAGNLAAGLITEFVNTPILGVTEILNEIPTLGGLNVETDDELKIRFRNTVFRNVSGTTDQYLALAVATQFTTKANVVGPISRYREYIQVPDVDDATPDPDSAIVGNGGSLEFTTSLSTIPYSKFTYTSSPFFLSNGRAGISAQYYLQDVDFSVNTTNIGRDRGDTYRGRINLTGPNVNVDTTTTYQPNLTLTNVYTGGDPLVQAIRPKDVLLFEHSYMSTASRNDYNRQVLNCVDLFINGQNPVIADAIIPIPSISNIFSALTSSRYYVENFRRVGQSNRRPTLGNIFQPLYSQPVIDLPDTIETEEAIYRKGIHYWAIEDVTELGGTVRARNGIEWAIGVAGDNGDTSYSAPKIAAVTPQAIEVIGYQYDKNISDLQISCEGAKQVTTDVLVHQATTRYFKLDVTVMYVAGFSTSDVNTNIRAAVADLFGSQYFGTVIQLSDILQAIHNTAGVDNVRWSKEILTNLGLTEDSSGNPRHRIVECIKDGNELADVLVDYQVNSTDSPCVQQMYLTGTPTAGTFTVTYNDYTSTPFAYNIDVATLQAQLRIVTGDLTLTVTGAGTPASPFIITFSTVGLKDLIGTTTSFDSSSAVYNSDFYLADDELPALATEALSTDSVPGMVIRTRAQSTWNQL